MTACIVPVDMGGSPTACRLRPPRAPLPTPALVEALCQHYRQERAPPHTPLEVAFFRGGVPDDGLLVAAAAAAGEGMRVACSPADLTRAAAARLWQRGVRTLELEVCTLHTPSLREVQRGYSGSRVVEGMLPSLRQQGFRLGVTLMPGLPASSHETSLVDARVLSEGAARVDFVRICPVLAWEGSLLAQDAAAGRWRPMHLGAAVTTTLAMVEILEAAGVGVARLGLHPGQDVPHAVAAGPYHPNLRQLVEVRRFYARLEALLRGVAAGSRVVVGVNPRDLAWVKGTANENLRTLRARLRLEDVEVRPVEAVARGQVWRLEVGRSESGG